MLNKMTNQLDFHGNALLLRAERQRVIASNIANADTPGYAARDINFSEALRAATGHGARPGAMAAAGSTENTGDARHMALSSTNPSSTLGYAVQTQPSLDNNTVDLDRERANSVNNAVRYEATLRFINGNAKTMLSAIQGQ
jgi:flagellar basal-body rod protein FlgB